MPRTLVPSFLLTALLMGSAVQAVPVGAAPPDQTRLSTPELIERAVRRGEVSRARGDLFLAYALTDHRRLPERYDGDVPWRGTLPLLHLRERLEKSPPTTERTQARELLASGVTSCSGNLGNLPNTRTTQHFWIQYKSGTIGSGLTIGSYATSLETSWAKEVTAFGWAAPPLRSTPGGARYHVAIANLDDDLYGYVSSVGTFAGFVGNNPNTSWNDTDAHASCMVLNRNYDPANFPSPPQASLDATTAHEFNHSLQYGVGALHGSNQAERAFFEGGATWMEDEVFDNANDNYFYLWPTFSMSMGQYTHSPYPYWVVFRAMTERFGVGTAGGGEQVMQDFWEETSKGTGNNLTAMQTAIANAPGSMTLADAYHDAAVALSFNRPCSGGFVSPYCLEEGPGYVGTAGATTVHKTIGSIGSSTTGSVEDNYALNWVRLPTSGGAYDVRLQNTSSGGELRGSVACDTGTALDVSPLPSILGPGAATSLTGFNPAGCSSVVLVITNQSQTAPNPSSSTARTYSVATTALLSNRTLSVAKDGTGSGTVTSAPSGISCQPPCSGVFADGTTVVLTATEDGSSAFLGWAGCASMDDDECTVVLDANRTVTASFGTGHPVQVDVIGSGTVTDGETVTCDASCSQAYVTGSTVTFFATPEEGSLFSGWTGDAAGCNQETTCPILVDGPKTIGAVFDDPPAEPVITLARPFVRTRPFPISWSADGASSYDLFVEEAPYDAPFGSERELTADGTSRTFRGLNGRTYCFTVVAHDSDLSSENTECTAVPANDRALSVTPSWERKTGTGYYRGTFSVSRQRGARLKLRDVRVDRLALVATRCASCGKVRVSFDGAPPETIDLRASTTMKNRLIHVLDLPSVAVGDVTIVIVSDGKPVRIEGLGVSGV